MRYGNRSPWKKIRSSPVTLIVMVVVVVFMSRAAWNMHKKSVASALRLDTARSSYRELEARHRDLSDRVAYLSTDEGIESEIRTKFRAVAEGEFVAVIVGGQQTAHVAQATSTERVSLWHKFVRSLGF